MSIKKLVFGLAVLAMVFAAAPAAQALTAADVAALSAALNLTAAQQASLMALVSPSAAAPSSAPIHPLTIGSTGSEVTALQNFLISKGFSIPAGATGYFGTQTQAALAAFQSANNIAPAVGYYGSITAGVVSGMIGGMPPVGGCPAGLTCTPTTPVCPAGFTCTPTGSGSGPLSGAAGSASYSTVSGLSNEEVGEDAEDVPVAGMEVEADDDSDIEITAVKLVFNEGTANQDFDEYATEVSIWLGDEEFARVDASEFTDESGTANDWTKTLTLDSGAIVRAGETEDLVVKVSGISNLDSADAGDTWTVDFNSIRFRDGLGDSTSEDPGFTVVTFSFDTFATASDLEMKTNLTSGNPDEGIVIVDSDGQDIDLIEFKITAEGSDLTVKEIPVALTGAGLTNIDSLTDELSLEWDGEEASESIGSSVGTTKTITFDDLEIVIEDGDSITFKVVAKSATTTVVNAAGMTLQGTITPDNIIAEDNSGEDIVDGDSTGSATGETQHIYDSAPMITVNSVDIDPIDNGTAASKSALATINLSITAEGATIYLNGNDETTENKEFWVSQVYGSGVTASTTASTTVHTLGGQYTVTNSGADNEYYTLNEGDTMTVRLDITVSQGSDATDTVISAGVRALMFQYGTDNTSDTTRSAVSLNWTDLTDQTQSGTASLVN